LRASPFRQSVQKATVVSAASYDDPRGHLGIDHRTLDVIGLGCRAERILQLQIHPDRLRDPAFGRRGTAMALKFKTFDDQALRHAAILVEPLQPVKVGRPPLDYISGRLL